MDKLVQSLGTTSLSKSQVSEMAKELDAHVEEFRTRRLEDAGPFTFVAADALVVKVREGGRVVPVHALVATGVNADGHREILGIQVTTSEDGAGWLAFFRDLTARGLSEVKLVTSDAHAGLTNAIAATIPGVAWQRCRTHHAANLMSATPKSSWGWFKALLHSIYDQPDAEAVHAQFDRGAELVTPAVGGGLEGDPQWVSPQSLRNCWTKPGVRSMRSRRATRTGTRRCTPRRMTSPLGTRSVDSVTEKRQYTSSWSAQLPITGTAKRSHLKGDAVGRAGACVHS